MDAVVRLRFLYPRVNIVYSPIDADQETLGEKDCNNDDKKNVVYSPVNEGQILDEKDNGNDDKKMDGKMMKAEQNGEEKKVKDSDDGENVGKSGIENVKPTSSSEMLSPPLRIRLIRR
jgi:hypothetical protein